MLVWNIRSRAKNRSTFMRRRVLTSEHWHRTLMKNDSKVDKLRPDKSLPSQVIIYLLWHNLGLIGHHGSQLNSNISQNIFNWTVNLKARQLRIWIQLNFHVAYAITSFCSCKSILRIYEHNIDIDSLIRLWFEHLTKPCIQPCRLLHIHRSVCDL